MLLGRAAAAVADDRELHRRQCIGQGKVAIGRWGKGFDDRRLPIDYVAGARGKQRDQNRKAEVASSGSHLLHEVRPLFRKWVGLSRLPLACGLKLTCEIRRGAGP